MSVCEKNGRPASTAGWPLIRLCMGWRLHPSKGRPPGELAAVSGDDHRHPAAVTNAAAPPSPCEFLIERTGRSFRADVAGLTDDGFAVRPVRGTDGDRGNLWPRHPLWCVLFSGDLRGLPVLCPGLRGFAISPGAFRLPDAIDDRCSPALSFRDVDWFEAHDAAFAAKLRINSDHNRVDNAAYGKTMHYAGIALYIPFRRFCRRNPGLKATRNISRCGRTGNGIGGRCV